MNIERLHAFKCSDPSPTQVLFIVRHNNVRTASEDVVIQLLSMQANRI